MIKVPRFFSFVKSASECAVTFGIIALFTLFLSCSFQEPVAPKWDVNLPIPLMNRSVTIQELVDKNDFLITNESGQVAVDYTEDLDRYEVGDQIKISGMNESFFANIGEVEIPSPGTRSATLNLSDIYPPSVMLNGQTTIVPPFSFQDLSVELSGYSNFESVVIGSGYIDVTVNNRLPVPLSAGTRLEVRDSRTDETIFQVEFQEQLAPNTQKTARVDLSGKRIPSHLKLVVSGGSPGSGTQPVTIDAYNTGIDLTAYISNITAIQATAVIEDQQFSGKDSLAIGDSIRVTSARIARGAFQMHIDNHIPLAMDINITLHDFYDAFGNPVVLFVPIGANATTNQFIDVSGYSYSPSVSSGSPNFHFSWEVAVHGSNGQFITISSQDNFGLDISFSEIVFSEVTGILDQVQVSLDPFEETIDLPDDLDSLQFEAARFELQITNAIEFPIAPDIIVEGVNENTGRSARLFISQPILAANGSPKETSIILDETNSNIISFLNTLPTRIRVSGLVKVGDGFTESTIKSTDYLEAKLHITMPLSLSFPAQTVETDVDTIEIDQDMQDEFRDNLLSGKLVAELENHLPLGTELSLYFSSQDTNVYENAELVIGPVTLMAAPISSQTGRVETPTSNSVLIQLSKTELQLFAHDNIFAGMKISLPGTNGQMCRIFANDYVNVKAYCEIKYHVDPEKSSE